MIMNVLNSTMPANKVFPVTNLSVSGIQDQARVTYIKIGIYDANSELIGYKADTFWHLSKTQPKKHFLTIDGEIPVAYIASLLYAVKSPDSHIELKADNLYVGYEIYDVEEADEYQTPVITHSIRRGMIRKLEETRK